ncbi:MAG: hypothetical protein ACRDYV_00675 [Acidimicrobiia bacterium]
MRLRVAILLGILAQLVGVPLAAAAGSTTPAVVCDPVLYLCA